MAELTVKINTNWLGSALGLNTVSSADADRAGWRALLDPVVNWVSDADRSGAIKALDVLKSARDVAYDSKKGTVLGDRATLQAYSKLKSVVTDEYQPNFSEHLSSGELKLSIAGLDNGQTISFAMPADDVRDEVWGQIGKQFPRTGKERAYEAVGQLLTADTVTQQVCAYAKLLERASSPNSAELTWQIPAQGAPVFRLGTLDIPYCTPIIGHGAHRDLGAQVTSRALCSMHYDGKCVVTGFHDFAAQHRPAKGTDGVNASELGFLRQAPQLVDAFKLLGLYEHGRDQGKYGDDLRREVERFATGMDGGTGDEDYLDSFELQCGDNVTKMIGCLKTLGESSQKPPPHIAPSRFA